MTEAIVKYYNRYVFELTPFFSEFKRSLKWRKEEVEELETHRDAKTMLAPSISLSECKLYAQYTLSLQSANQYIRYMTQNLASGQDRIGLYAISKSLS